MSDESLFAAALELPASERAAFLNANCPDPAVRKQVEELLSAAAASNPLDQPLPDLDRTNPRPATADESTASVGDRVGPYKLLEKIGEGGMGEVWVADQLEPIKRRVALKLIKPGMDSRSVLGRFEAERQALAVMDHPNIAKVYEAGTTVDGRPYFVMELVKGTPITEFADARKLTPKQRLELFVPVCQAIQHAHMKGIIHRDIKPSNVLVALHDETPVPKVIDFGVAKAIGQQLTEKTIYTGFGALVGTPAYMAPEQATFNQLDVDTRADVYALGVLLYELLAGSPPIERERLKKAALDEVLRMVREEEPPRPSQRLSTADTRAGIAAVRGTEPEKLSALMKGELDWIVMKALEKDRTRRYETANGFAADITRYLSGEPVQAVPPSVGYRLRKFYRRNRAAVQVVSFFVFMALGAAVMGAVLAVRATDAERTARRAEADARQQRDELRKSLVRQMADQTQADLLRLRLIGDALATTVSCADDWDEARYVRWMSEVLEAEPELYGLCIAFEPDTVRPKSPRPPTAQNPCDPHRDGYSLYVRHVAPGPPTAEPLRPSYRYRAQPWYAGTLQGADGLEEPADDLYGQMVCFTHALARPGDRRPIGAACVDLSVEYFQRLDARLSRPHFGPDSYAFVTSAKGRIITHPHLPAGTPVFSEIGTVWPDAAGYRRILSAATESVSQIAGVDAATGRPAEFLFVRFRPAGWVLVAVIPEHD